MQIVYHGSNCIIEHPEILKTKYIKDFGDGFYCTIIKEQAQRWADKYEKKIVNIYEYEESTNLKIKEFAIMSEEWLDFIIDCRSGKSHNYDIVIGPMADDQIYNYITALINGEITREAFWELAKFRYPTHQIAFCSNKSLDTIKYVGCEAND